MNKAIGLFTQQTFFEAGDYCLTTRSTVDWSALPTSPDQYAAIFPSLFSASSEQSVYQQMLPSKLQLLEFMQPWLKDATIGLILNRLKRATPVPVAQDILNPFL